MTSEQKRVIIKILEDRQNSLIITKVTTTEYDNSNLKYSVKLTLFIHKLKNNEKLKFEEKMTIDLMLECLKSKEEQNI